MIDLIKQFFDWLYGSPSQSLQQIIQSVAAVPHFDFSFGWVKGLYNSMGGLAVIIGLAGIVVIVLVGFARNDLEVRALTYLADCGKLMALVFFLPTMIGVAIVVVKSVNYSLIGLAQQVNGGQWAQGIASNYGYSFAGGGAVQAVTQIASWLLHATLAPQAVNEAIVLILALPLYIASKITDFSSRFVRGVWGVLVTTLISQPVTIIILVTGGSFVQAADVDDTTKAYMVMALIILANLALVGIFLLANYVTLEAVSKRLNAKVEGDVDANWNNSPPSESQLVDERSDVQNERPNIDPDPSAVEKVIDFARGFVPFPASLAVNLALEVYHHNTDTANQPTPIHPSEDQSEETEPRRATTEAS